MAAADPWIVAPGERAKHEEQFRTLSGGTGMVSGDAAKKFFLQSRLPPQVLGVIWSLADINGDGKLDLFEFSIACKLINLKIRGVNLPPSLPPQLKQTACGAPAAGSQQMLGGLMAGPIPGMPLMQPLAQPTPVRPIGMAMGSAPMAPMPAGVSTIPSAMPTMPGGIPTMPGGVPTMPGGVQTIPGGVPTMPGGVQTMAGGAPIMPGGVPAMPGGAAIMPGVMPTGTAMVPGAAPVGAAAMTRTASQESGESMGSEWGVPQASKLKFTQVFNAIDRNKSGFLSGVQARNILVQSKLPNPVLAQIWGLSDVDGDGQLSCEEFVLALYLCEQTKAGVPLPSVLPPELIPPTQRRASVASLGSGGAGTGGAAGTPTEASVPAAAVSSRLSSLGEPPPQAAATASAAAAIGPQNFEDKRRENYSKGQAELERRRKALLEAQRRETEERLRREREEEAKKEKARAEAEKKRQEELRQEMLRQQEQQELKEQELKRQEELKEQARKDAEKQRQQEWEKQRLQELMNVRQRQQESLMALKAQNQSLTIELQTKDDRIKELTGKISETRCHVTEVKATIDNMRSTRDTHMQDMNSLKAQARDQNHRLLVVNQERAQLKARSAAAAGAAGGGETPAVEAMVDAKKVVIAQLKEKQAELESEMTKKEEDFNNNIIAVRTLKEELKESMERGKELYARFTSKRNEVLSLREKLVNPDAAWGEEPEPVYVAGDTAEAAGAAPAGGAVVVGSMYRGLYEFQARNGDELSFMPGDIITVTLVEGTDPGWLGGELNGKTGWFPEAYCELIEGSGEQLQQQAPVAAAVADVSPAVLGPALALFCWTPQHNNQLAFAPGQRVLVREQVSGWMFGECGDLGGWFPSNFVALETTNPTLPPAMQSPPAPPDLPDFLAHDEASEFYISNFAYESTEPGDLNFSAGQSVLVVQKEGDWWTGVSGDQHGVFPSNFVELAPQQLLGTDSLESAPAPDTSATTPTTAAAPAATSAPAPAATSAPAPAATIATPATASAAVTPAASDTEAASDAEAAAEVAATMAKSSRRESQGKSGKKPEIATVLAPYDATSSNQLSLQRGQLVMIRKKTASGWWEGELQAKGKKRQVGWFPASYVKPLGGGSASARSTPVFQEATNILDAPPAQTPPSNTETKPVTAAAAAPAADKTAAAPERVEALYPYTAVNPDELTFVAGAIITVLDKEDAAWWKGSLNGTEGVFPSNYVQAYTGDGGDSFAAQVSQIAAAAADFGVDLEDGNLCSHDNWGLEAQTSEPEDPRRQRCITEIIESEKQHLNDLKLVKKHFLDVMRASPVVNKDELDEVFVNWEELVAASSHFNEALRVRRTNSVNGRVVMVGDVLCQQIRGLTPYMRFCSVQLRGSALLGERSSEGGAWQELLRQCQEHPDVRGHTLTGFLLKPMQRITRYPLLISKLLSRTPRNHPDHHNTVEALAESKTLCQQVNEAVAETDNTEKLEWLQKNVRLTDLPERLVFNSLTNFKQQRKLLYMGLLHKSKSGREVLVFLLSDFLLLCTAQRSLGSCSTSLAALNRALSTTAATLYKKPMLLEQLAAVRSENRDNELELVYCNGEEVVSMVASSSTERDNWLHKINDAQRALRDARSTLFSRQQSEEKQGIVGRVLLTVLHGCNILDTNDRGEKTESFCEVSLGSQVRETDPASGHKPHWDSSMQFYVKSLADDRLCITVMLKGYFRPNDYIGRAELLVQRLWEKQRRQQHPVPQLIKVTLQETSAKDAFIVVKYSLILFEKRQARPS